MVGSWWLLVVIIIVLWGVMNWVLIVMVMWLFCFGGRRESFFDCLVNLMVVLVSLFLFMVFGGEDWVRVVWIVMVEGEGGLVFF